MSRTPATLRFRQESGTLTFRAEGSACMTHAFALRRRAETGLSQGVTALRVDLGSCTFMDSTFVGTLLFLKKTTDRGGRAFALVEPSIPCRALLQQMGVEDLFAVVKPDETTVDWTTLTNDMSDLDGCKRGVVQAHAELAEVPGPAGEQFRKVMQCLAKEG